MKTNSQIRSLASESINGSWGKSAWIFFLVSLISGLCSAVSGDMENPVMVTLSMVAAIFIGWPVTFGFRMTMLALARDGKRPEVSGMGSALNGQYYLKCIGLYLLINIFTFLWSLLLIIPGIIKGISYSMAPYILAENPEIGCLEAINRSQKMMCGYKWQYFFMSLGCLGWIILSIFTLFIGSMWIVPYYEVAYSHFYLEVKKEYEANNQPQPQQA